MTNKEFLEEELKEMLVEVKDRLKIMKKFRKTNMCK
jgi:hypothetical protein